MTSLFAQMPLEVIVQAISDGFGGTIGKIGIVIIAGTIIGTFLEHSGGAFSLAQRILKIIGEKHVPLAMSLLGWIVSVPVFSDSAFIILSPLNKALSKKVKISLAGSAPAQGSGTVGIITSASIMAPLMEPLGFVSGPEKALVVLAIGSGGIIFSHANDSFFWVFTQVSGMDVKTGVKVWTTGTLVLGASLGFAVWIVSLFIL